MKSLLSGLLLLLAINASGQSNIMIGQYFKLMQAFAPGLTGANGFFDIRTGARYQWLGYDGAPTTNFISGSGIVYTEKNNPYKFNSVRVSDMSPYSGNSTRISAGAYVFKDKIGEFEQLEAMGTAAIHVPVKNGQYLSLGISAGYYNTKLNINDIFVLRPKNDYTYQDLLQNGATSNFLKLNSGIAFFSNRFYTSYSISNLLDKRLSGELFIEDFAPSLVHNLLGGFTLTPAPRLEVIPNAFIRYSSVLPFLFDVGVRVRYQQNPYLGLSYRNDGSFIGMIGVSAKDKFNFGYSFEHKVLRYSSNNFVSHEIVIGLQLFNHNKYVPLW